MVAQDPDIISEADLLLIIAIPGGSPKRSLAEGAQGHVQP